MVETIPTLLAIGAAVLVVVALAAMYTEQWMAAGMSFLSASVVLYLRETRLRDPESDAG